MAIRVAADIYAVKEIGLDAWMRRDFSWPFPDADYFRLLDVTWGNFYDLYVNVPEEVRDIVLSDVRFVSLLAAHFNALALKCICKKEHLELVTGPLSEGYLNLNYNALARAHQLASKWDRFNCQLKRIAKNATYNSNLGIAARLKCLLNTGALGLGSFSGLKSEFAKKFGQYVDNHYWSTFLSGCPKRHPHLPGELKTAILCYLDRCEGYCSDHFDFRIDVQRIGEVWFERLSALHAIIEHAYKVGKDHKELLLTEDSQPIHRAVAHGFQRKGKPVIGFIHGNNLGSLFMKNYVYSGMSSCTEFVCHTQPIAKTYETFYIRSSLSNERRIRFISLESEHYRDIWARGQSMPFPDKTETVMLMGFPMHAYRYDYLPAYFFAFHLDLEIRLITLLKRYGFRVLYKVHPDRLKEASDIFELIADEVIPEPFESVWHRADAILIKYICSSTFGFALCTNRPLYVFDYEKPYMEPLHYEMIRGRCHMVPSWVSGENRIEFDQDYLVEELSQKPVYPDYASLEKLIFPAGDGRTVE